MPSPRRRSQSRRTTLRTVLAVPALALALLGLVACGDSETETPTAQTGQCAYPEDGRGASRQVEAPPVDPPDELATEVTVSTDRGDVPISLDTEQATCAVNSFLSLADQGYFDDTTCHRLTEGGLSVLQCGDPTGTGTGGPGYSFRDELEDNDPRLQPCLDQSDPSTGAQVCTYPAGTVAMANGGPDTNGSQFFLVYEDSALPNAYTVLGRMSAAGLKVVRDVAAQGIAADGTSPQQSVTITGVSD